MDIDKAQPSAHEFPLLDEEQGLVVGGGLSLGERMKQIEDFGSLGHPSAGQLADDDRMEEDVSALEELR